MLSFRTLNKIINSNYEKIFCFIWIAIISICLTSMKGYSQDIINFDSKPNIKQFNKICKKIKADTINIGNFQVLEVRYYKTYFFGDKKQNAVKFENILYLVNDSIILKSYKFKSETNITEPPENLFLFPDSSLGIVIHEYVSPFGDGTCGACVKVNLKFVSIKQNLKLNTLMNIEYSDGLSYIKINNKGIYGQIQKDKMYNQVKYIEDWDNESNPTIKIELLKKGEKLKISLDGSIYKNGKLIYHHTNLYFTFYVINNVLVYKFDKSTFW